MENVSAREMNSGKQFTGFSKIALIVLAVLTAVGVGFWIYQLIHGLSVTGMSITNSWGAYIILFMFFVGLSAGGLIVASSAHVFNIESFKKVALPAVITSTVCICLAGMFVLIDLGGIQKILNLFIHPNFTSPLLWDICVITLYLVINILDIVWMVKGKEHKVKILSYFALPTAILVHSVTAWIFGLQIGRTWYTAVLAPIFVASACDSGLSLLLIVLVFLEGRGVFQTGSDLFAKLGKLLAVFIAADAFFLICELLTMGYPGATESVALQVMAGGATAPYFWFEMICGLLIPFIIMAIPVNRTKKPMIILASTLVVLGVLCKRIWLLLTAFITPYAATTGVHAETIAHTESLTFGAAGAFYTPTGVEWAIVIGVLALGVLAFLLLCQGLLKRKAN